MQQSMKNGEIRGSILQRKTKQKSSILPNRVTIQTSWAENRFGRHWSKKQKTLSTNTLIHVLIWLSKSSSRKGQSWNLTHVMDQRACTHHVSDIRLSAFGFPVFERSSPALGQPLILRIQTCPIFWLTPEPSNTLLWSGQGPREHPLTWKGVAAIDFYRTSVDWFVGPTCTHNLSEDDLRAFLAFCLYYHLLVGLVPKSCPTLATLLRGSSAHGILQARILDWAAISFSNYHPLEHPFYCLVVMFFSILSRYVMFFMAAYFPTIFCFWSSLPQNIDVPSNFSVYLFVVW